MTAVPESNKTTAKEYLKTPETNRHTELWDGEIVNFASPTIVHQEIVGGMYAAILAFISNNQGPCKPLLSPLDVVFDETHVVQPDVFVVCNPSKLDGKFCNGAPDWIVEVTSTNRSDDFDRKLRLYKKHGVREYWIVDTDERKVWVYVFEQHPNVVEMYDWADTIPVHIYGGRLSIRIADLV